jgi:LacI family transcriptional regulator
VTPLQRHSLPDQIAERLQQGITAARWLRELPSEAELCRELRVSRVTLRKGIGQLIRGGWLTAGGRGCHHRIRKHAKRQKGTSGHIVRVLSPFSTHSLGSIQHVLLGNVAEQLGAAGFRLEFECRPSLFTRHAPEELKRLSALPDTAAWVLKFSTPSMQRWFAENRIPCLVFGRPEEAMELPCIFSDAPVISRHAAGLFCQRGHRELVYCIAEFTSLNDRLCSNTFAQEAQRLGARAQIITHKREPSALSRQLDALLSAEPRPTAFFSTCPEHCLTILCHLLNAGLRVPADASIIAGGDDEFLHFALPKFACYRVDGVKTGRKTAALLMDLIRNGRGQPSNVSILPTFVAGETLGSAP